MASVPPNKCLRGIVRLPLAAAAIIGSNTDCPIVAYVWDSQIGDKQELQYQKADGTWVDISRGSTTPGITEGTVWQDGSPNEGGRQRAVDEINAIGIKEWNVRKFQKWVNDNLYAFFNPLIAAAQATSRPTTELTFVDDVNSALADMFLFFDTNNDGIPEFHGK